MSSLDDVLSTALALQHELDEIVQSIEDLWDQAQADWISFRLSSIGVVLRDRGGGPIAAVLARGLLEQAAYWDWAIATGVDQDLVPRQAALELQRLHRAAESTDDDIWTKWLLPPGAEVGAAGTKGMPRSAADAVKRLGNGLDAACLEPLQFGGLFASYRLLEVLTHTGVSLRRTRCDPAAGPSSATP